MMGGGAWAKGVAPSQRGVRSRFPLTELTVELSGNERKSPRQG